MKLFLFIAIAVCYAVAEDVRLDDLEPNVAQQYIESKDQSLKYAPKIESNVPAVRFLGNEPHHVVEDIYLANQYHGQDGVGGYLYGYSVPDISKTEKKKAGGDLTGAYNYVNGDGQEIKVEYWDNGNGFHQIDNVPKILPKQIDDTPEVQAAKDEHARIWKEQAERNSKPIPSPYANNEYKPEIAALIGAQPQQQHQGQYQQPQGQYQQPQGQYQQPQGQYQQSQGQYQQPQGQYNQPQGQYNQPQGQQPQSYKPVNVGQPTGNVNQVDYSGQYSANEETYAKQHKEEDEEEKGPPRGFFYNFDYPVGIIVGKEGNQVQKRESLGEVYAKNKEVLESQLKQGAAPAGEGYPNYFVTA